MKPHPTLKAAIAAAGSKTALAAVCGVTPQSVSQWRVVPGRHLVTISRAFAIPLEDLAAGLCAEHADAAA